ncbi:hypothetical protein WG915_05845 [Corynebacterium sp. H128]|uniref:hypothetical protein n=1 Tax=unclassified Corynebacterium TaxID=2624378 RepID=UPI0030B334D8
MKQKISLAVLVLLAVIIGTAVREKMPQAEAVYNRPFEYETSAPRFGTLGTVEARLSDSVDGYHTTETFVAVTFEFTRSEYEAAPMVGMIDGKKRKVRSLQIPRCSSSQTGVPGTCTVEFEVAKDAVAGSQLRFAPGWTEAGAPVIVRPLEITGGSNG